MYRARATSISERRGRHQLVLAVAASVVLSACGSQVDEPESLQGPSANIEQPAASESDGDGDELRPVADPELAKSAKASHQEGTLDGALARTACIIQGTVTDISESYDDWDGPRTNVTLKVDASHYGRCNDETVVLPMFGGTLPNGRRVGISHAPKFSLGSQHVVFLHKEGWKLQPIVYELSFRVESAFGKHFLVDREGQAIQGLSSKSIAARGKTLIRRHGIDQPSELAAEATASDVEALPTPESFVDAVKTYASARKLAQDTDYRPVRKADFKWNEIPVDAPENK